MHVNGVAISITSLGEDGQPLEAATVYAWTPGAIRALEETGKETGGSLLAIGKKTAAEVRRALTTLYPKIKPGILADG